MRKFDYSIELANVVKNFLEEDDWNYSFDANTGVFDFSLRSKSKIKKINFAIDVQDDEIIVYGISPVGADFDNPEMMARMAEFICRANYGLKNGCFEIDFSDGEVRFRSFIDCDGFVPNTKVVQNSVHCTAAMFRRYAPGIIDIIFADKSAKEAIEMCEKSPEEELRAVLSELNLDNLGDSVEDVIARLADRLGAGEEETSNSDCEIQKKEIESHEMTEDVDEMDNIVTLHDEDGDEISFEFLDLIEYEDEEYVVLLPVDDTEGEVVILRVEDSDDVDFDGYVSVENEDTLMTLFNIFKEKFKDEFDFVSDED